jgi:hypothetical protein
MNTRHVLQEARYLIYERNEPLSAIRILLPIALKDFFSDLKEARNIETACNFLIIAYKRSNQANKALEYQARIDEIRVFRGRETGKPVEFNNTLVEIDRCVKEKRYAKAMQEARKLKTLALETRDEVKIREAYSMIAKIHELYCNLKLQK